MEGCRTRLELDLDILGSCYMYYGWWTFSTIQISKNFASRLISSLISKKEKQKYHGEPLRFHVILMAIYIHVTLIKRPGLNVQSNCWKHSVEFHFFFFHILCGFFSTPLRYAKIQLYTKHNQISIWFKWGTFINWQCSKKKKKKKRTHHFPKLMSYGLRN